MGAAQKSGSVRIGLTGGIGSGKSTVARLLAERGAAHIDADQLAREVVEPGQPALAEIVEAFGPVVVDAGGRLRRDVLGARVFADPQARARLEAITHPRIRELAAARMREAEAAGHRHIVYEAALLVEVGLAATFDHLVVVSADEATQIERVMARDGCSEAEARARIAAQLPLAQKVAVADTVVDNTGTPEETARQVDALLARLETP
ncbi:MAG: dephospho-CoA kinase [Deltaproteobacteria bacterium]|nr:dephospho-CoA kinase [Deltaproteobacteria bacterium]